MIESRLNYRKNLLKCGIIQDMKSIKIVGDKSRFAKPNENRVALNRSFFAYFASLNLNSNAERF